MAQTGRDPLHRVPFMRKSSLSPQDQGRGVTRPYSVERLLLAKTMQLWHHSFSMNRWRQWRKRLAKFFIGGVLILILLRWFEHSQVFHPSRTMDATGAELGRRFEEVALTTSDGLKLHAWFFPAAINSPRAPWVMLVCHGNAGNITDRLDLCRALLSTGVGVFLFDYRGYGRSQGRPSEEGTYLDAQAAHHWLQLKGFAPTNILVFGESLGGGVASELGVRETVGG